MDKQFYEHLRIFADLFLVPCDLGQSRPEGRNRRGETRLRGPGVFGPLRGLGIRPLVSVIWGLGNPFPEAP